MYRLIPRVTEHSVKAPNSILLIKRLGVTNLTVFYYNFIIIYQESTGDEETGSSSEEEPEEPPAKKTPGKYKVSLSGQAHTSCTYTTTGTCVLVAFT